MNGMAQPDFNNPCRLPGFSYPAEREFVERVVNGEDCVIGDGRRPQKRIEQGDGANVIRAEVICFFARGGVEGARTCGDTIMMGAWVDNELDLSFADIGFVLALCGCHFDKKINLEHAKCPTLYLSGSHLGDGLKADGIRVSGALCLRENFSSTGEVRLLTAKIGDDLDCHNSNFSNPGKKALAADSANIGRCLLFKFTGKVRMNGVSVGTHLDCRGATFSDEVHVSVAEIKNTLVLQDIKGTGVFNFAATKAERIADDNQSRERFKFSLDGLTYRRFLYPGDIESRIKWLKNRPDGHSFSPQPFEQAAKVLFEMGRDSDARKILLTKEQLHTKEGAFSTSHKWWRNILGWIAGYGYQLEKTLAWSLSVIAVCGALFFAADRMCHIVPSQPAVMAHVNNQELVAAKCPGMTRPTEVAVCLFPEYPRFHPLSYSLDAFIPFFSLNQESYWHPQPAKADNFVDRWFFAFWYGLEVFLGWVLTSLLVLFATGLLKPRQSSGE